MYKYIISCLGLCCLLFMCSDFGQKWAPIKYEKLVLVGAFSDFGTSDTGNPVQILAHICVFEAWLEI